MPGPASGPQPAASASPSQGAGLALHPSPLAAAIRFCLLLGALCGDALLWWEPCAEPNPCCLGSLI